MSKTSMDRRNAEAALAAAQSIATDTIMQQLRGVLHDIFDPYRPELHYMRGPGPAWRAKHAGETAAIEQHG
jgi:hypothetical protein